jgi:hypothetical protein
MNRCLENTWFRHAVLLVALAAGGLMTRAIPTYEEMAALQNQPVRPSAASRVRDHASTGVTGIDIDQRHLKLAQRAT